MRGDGISPVVIDDASGLVTNKSPETLMRTAWLAYRMRWKRRRLRVRAWRKSTDLRPTRTPPRIQMDDVLCFAVIRNERDRLPFWLDHYRALGVDRFLIVDNQSDDGSAEILSRAADVSLWTTDASYRDAHFGIDWLSALLVRYGTKRWCVVADADELLIYPHWRERPLRALGRELDRRGQAALGALMIELYPQGRLSQAGVRPNRDPIRALPWFDATGYRVRRQKPADNLWVQGGPRDRLFFADAPARAPTLNKLPFLRWQRGYAWLNSTHAALPPRLNRSWDGPGDPRLSGALLHTKFLPQIVEKSADPCHRAAHFGTPEAFGRYHDALAADPVLWHPDARRYDGWQQLERLGLMSSGGW